MPGPPPSANSSSGYGFQWCVPDNSGAYCAIGVYKAERIQ
jgi:hypothetical protein